ncbi:MAG: TFIIB-type zinc ribbon-containing protein [Candidatus Nanoarchaeia archaeon]
MLDVEKLNKCPECGSENVVHDKEKDSLICKDCGVVFSELAPEAEKQEEDASDII